MFLSLCQLFSDIFSSRFYTFIVSIGIIMMIEKTLWIVIWHNCPTSLFWPKYYLLKLYKFLKSLRFCSMHFFTEMEMGLCSRNLKIVLKCSLCSEDFRNVRISNRTFLEHLIPIHEMSDPHENDILLSTIKTWWSNRS